MYHTENIIIVNNNILFIYLSPIKASPALQSVPQSNPSENPR
jgi:hypothetical protein